MRQCARSEMLKFAGSIFRWQTDDLHDALQIVSAIIFDFDSALFLAVMQNHARPEILLQTRLQMFKCISVNRNDRWTAVTRFRLTDLARDQSLGCPYRRTASQNRFGDGQLFRRRFEGEQNFGMAD